MMPKNIPLHAQQAFKEPFDLEILPGIVFTIDQVGYEDVKNILDLNSSERLEAIKNLGIAKIKSWKGILNNETNIPLPPEPEYIRYILGDHFLASVFFLKAAEHLVHVCRDLAFFYKAFTSPTKH
jgi:hypothetical protein